MVIKVLLALLFPLILTMLLEKRRPKGIIWGKGGYIVIGDTLILASFGKTPSIRPSISPRKSSKPSISPKKYEVDERQRH